LAARAAAAADQWSVRMFDIIMMALGVGSFVVMLGFAVLCDKI
jgi:hypothetical protein